MNACDGHLYRTAIGHGCGEHVVNACDGHLYRTAIGHGCGEHVVNACDAHLVILASTSLVNSVTAVSPYTFPLVLASNLTKRL